MKDIPLSERDGTELRHDCVTANGEAITWGTAIDLFQNWGERASNDDALVQEWNRTSVMPFSGPGEYRQIDRLTELKGNFRSENHTPFVYVITLSANPLSEGQWQAPADFYSDLTASWEAIRNRVYKITEGTEYCYVRILSPSGHGYPVMRLCLLTDTQLDSGDVESVLTTHVENSPVAHADRHHCDRCLRHGRSLELDELVRDNLRGIGKTRDEEQSRALTALLWATNTPRFDYSNGCQSYIETDGAKYSPTMVEL